jgi:hypothetical protein
MQCPVIAAAKWHRELVTYSASHGAVLCKSDLMSSSRTTAADQTRVGRRVFRGAVKFLRSGLILAALFRETVQSSAVQVFGGCLNRTVSSAIAAPPPQNVARTIAIVFIFILLIDDCFTNILSVYGRTMPESLAF